MLGRAIETARRAGEMLREHQLEIHSQTDRLFAGLLAVQWLAGIAAAVWISPKTWAGTESQTHLHVWTAIFLGGAIAIFPIALVVTRSGRPSTRYVIAVAQMLTSSLLVQLTGGRIETHFHVFGSLAFLSFYRDWRVLVPATLVVAVDHFLRGVYWPQSVFGVITGGQWRWLEHAAWVLFEDVFLVTACLRSEREMRSIANASAELEASEHRYRAVMEQAAEGICLLDQDTKQIIECNNALRRLLAFKNTILSELNADLFSSGQLALTESMLQPAESPTGVPFDLQYVRPDGELIDLSVTVSRISYGSRQVLCAILRDVTERRRAQQALQDSEERYGLAALGSNDGMWDWNLKTGELYLSPRCQQLLGLNVGARSDVIHWFSRIEKDDRNAFDVAMRAHLEGRSSSFEQEHRVSGPAGTTRWILCRGVAVRDAAGEPSRMAGSQTDVTDRHLIEEQLRHAALHDALTGLANRALFAELLTRALARARRHREYRFAVLFVDLDRFKVINDSLGHLAGDQLLRDVATRLQACLRATDVIARFGGDEFTILVDDIRSLEDAKDLASRIQGQLKACFDSTSHEICVTASVGIALASSSYEKAEDLLRDADIAMYKAKSLGKNRYEVFNASMHDGAVARLALEVDLRRGLERGEFRVHYQPIMSLANQRVVGFEALLRWQRTEGALVPPNDFIPTAEETGLIVPLGLWTLREACQQLKAWQSEFPSDPPLTMAVNIAARQLEEPSFVDDVASAILETGIAPGTLHLELTETALVASSDAMLAKLAQLKDLSVRLDLDDFGTGYSSLSYLQRFPLDVIKIDRSFLRKMQEQGTGDETLVEAIVTLAKTLGLGVVAEGVETAAQLSQLQRANCSHGQGYLFSPPTDVATVNANMRLRTGAAPFTALSGAVGAAEAVGGRP